MFKYPRTLYTHSTCVVMFVFVWKTVPKEAMGKNTTPDIGVVLPLIGGDWVEKGAITRKAIIESLVTSRNSATVPPNLFSSVYNPKLSNIWYTNNTSPSMDGLRGSRWGWGAFHIYFRVSSSRCRVLSCSHHRWLKTIKPIKNGVCNFEYKCTHLCVNMRRAEERVVV